MISPTAADLHSSASVETHYPCKHENRTSELWNIAVKHLGPSVAALEKVCREAVPVPLSGSVRLSSASVDGCAGLVSVQDSERIMSIIIDVLG
jgi:hypothetical protein